MQLLLGDDISCLQLHIPSQSTLFVVLRAVIMHHSLNSTPLLHVTSILVQATYILYSVCVLLYVWLLYNSKLSKVANYCNAAIVTLVSRSQAIMSLVRNFTNVLAASLEVVYSVSVREHRSSSPFQLHLVRCGQLFSLLHF